MKHAAIKAAVCGNWTLDPEAQAILRSCVTDPPAGEWKRTYYVTTRDEWFEYQGARVDRLIAIRNRVFDSIGTQQAAEEFRLAPDVHEAINRVRDDAEPCDPVELRRYFSDPAYAAQLDAETAANRALANAAIDAGIAKARHVPDALEVR